MTSHGSPSTPHHTTPLSGQQVLLDVVVVRTGDHGRGGPVRTVLEFDTGHALVVIGDLLDVAVVGTARPSFRPPDHGAHDFVHAAHGIPRTEHGVGVVHEAVQGRCFFRFGAQEQHREFDDLEEAFVAEVFAGMLLKLRRRVSFVDCLRVSTANSMMLWRAFEQTDHAKLYLTCASSRKSCRAPPAPGSIAPKVALSSPRSAGISTGPLSNQTV